MGQLAPRYPAAQVEAQLEEVQQEVGDYPVQVQPEMVEQEHQEIQPREDIEEDPEEIVLRMMRQKSSHSSTTGFFWRSTQMGIL
jgi:hypothetical protein